MSELTSSSDAGTLRMRLGRYDEAIAQHGTSVAQKRARFPPDHPDILFSLIRAAER